MDYYKLTINISPFEEWVRDLLTAQLSDSGFEGFTETEAGLEAFIPVESFNENVLSEILADYENGFRIHKEKELIKDRNWNEEWEKNYFKPLVIAGECLVRAPFHKDFPSCRYEIVIEPNMAFGTGNHETTSMMLEGILKEDMTGKKVLDMGCGTGILGILASMKGAAAVTAVDIDQRSVSGTEENASMNGVGNLKVLKGDASVLGFEKYDIIFANIHKNVLIEDAGSYSRTLIRGGKIFMSGFYAEDLEDIKRAAALHGLHLKGVNEKNRWTMAVFQS
jgi:ribosomal protein L11 methyltransferase